MSTNLITEDRMQNSITTRIILNINDLLVRERDLRRNLNINGMIARKDRGLIQVIQRANNNNQLLLRILSRIQIVIVSLGRARLIQFLSKLTSANRNRLDAKLSILLGRLFRIRTMSIINARGRRSIQLSVLSSISNLMSNINKTRVPVLTRALLHKREKSMQAGRQKRAPSLKGITIGQIELMLNRRRSLAMPKIRRVTRQRVSRAVRAARKGNKLHTVTNWQRRTNPLAAYGRGQRGLKVLNRHGYPLYC